MTAETFSSVVGSGWRCYGYNQLGQTDQSSLSVTADGTTTTQTVNATYNDVGQPTSLVYPDGEMLSTAYDNNDYLRSAFFGGTDSTVPVPYLVGQVSYTNNGQLSGMAFGGCLPPPSTPVWAMMALLIRLVVVPVMPMGPSGTSRAPTTMSAVRSV